MLCEARSLVRRFPSPDGGEIAPVDGVDLEISAGSMTLISGPSGTGKSTLLMLLGGLLRPTSGDVIFDGRPTAAMSDAEMAKLRARRVGYLFQNSRIAAALTVRENIEFAARIAGRSAARREIDYLLEMTGLEDRGGHMPHQLSGGQMRRAMIASVLARDPDLILADEVTNDLDDEQSGRILDILRRRASSGKAVVLVSHVFRGEEGSMRYLTMKNGHLSAI